MQRYVQKTSKELLQKGKPAEVVILCAVPFNVFRLSNSDDDLETKSMRKSKTYKDLGNSPDIRALDASQDESEVPVTDLKIDLKDDDVCEKHLVSDQNGE